MQLTLDSKPNANVITGLDGTHVRIREQTYSGSLWLTADNIESPWPVASIGELDADSWASLLAQRPEIVLLGTGSRLVFPAPAQMAPLMQHGVGYEVMDTAAACRTYNVLLGEGRAVGAALILDGADAPTGMR